MGTFNLEFTTGSPAYGHVGDTYGYQSSTTFFPDLNGALAVASDGETLTQAQPADATCRVYKALAALAKGSPLPTGCAFKVHRHFFGHCRCDGEVRATEAEGEVLSEDSTGMYQGRRRAQAPEVDEDPVLEAQVPRVLVHQPDLVLVGFP